MPELIHRLFGEDSGFLNIVADQWAVELPPARSRDRLPQLVSRLLDRDLFLEIVQSLPQEAKDALTALKRRNGSMPWLIFTRQFGELRIMGPGKRERLKPYLQPVSACETLWYRALIGRDFLEVDGNIIECAYIPGEFLAWLPTPPPALQLSLGERVSLEDNAIIHLATDAILDMSCTLLASLRLAQPNAIRDLAQWQPSFKELMALMHDLKMIDSQQLPNQDVARPFLSSTRSEALHFLAQGWLKSKNYNDLALVPSISLEAKIKNDPLMPRQALLGWLKRIPGGEWWSIEALVRAFHAQQPDFLRPDGNYDSWMVRSSLTEEPLQGFSAWYAVEGALLRYLLVGPLHWLGFLDLAGMPYDEKPVAFRLSAWFNELAAGKVPDLGEEIGEPIVVNSGGTLSMTSRTPRFARYMLSRFCTWEGAPAGVYAYRLTPASLKAAREQGLTASHLVSLLRRYAKSDLPPSLIKAINRWDEVGGEVRAERVSMLRVSRAEILEELRNSPAARFLGEPLGPLTVIVPEDALEKVMAALARMGYLSDVNF